MIFWLLALIIFVQAETSPVPSQLPLGLVGTIILNEQEKSLATLVFTKSKETGAFRKSAALGTLATLNKIERDRVFVKNSKTGALEVVKLGAYDPKRAVDKKAISAPGGEREFHVRRSLIDNTLKDLPTFLQGARAVPVMDASGNVNGFKLDWISGGSLYEQLGLKQGDVLREVNGIKLDGVAKAIEIFKQFQNSSLIRLGSERDGKPLELNYLIRE